MSKVLIDRELLSVASLHLEYSGYTETGKKLRALLAAPSGTPAMPVKAYYHEAPNEYGGLNKSVGLEVRKEFPDAPLVLEAEALARIACLEGEIATRDEELAACRVAVENCEVFRARILELESQYQRDVFGLNNEGDPIGGDPAGGYANDNARLRAELAALNAQEPVAYRYKERADDARSSWIFTKKLSRVPDGHQFEALYAAPVSEAKAHGVVMPEHETSTPSSKWASAVESDPHGKAYDCERAELSMGEYTDDELANAVFMHDHRSFDIAATMRGEPGSIVLLTAAKDRIRWLSRSLDKALARLNAAPVQQVSVPDVLREAIKWADHLCFECGALVQTRAPSVHVYNKTFEAVQAAKAMLAAAPVQQVVPDDLRIGVWSDALKKIAKYAPPVNCTARTELDRVGLIAVHALIAFSAPQFSQPPSHQESNNAAPAAPAADAGGVLEQAMYTLISIGYHENSGLVHELRQALAAHRSTGVV